MSTLFKKMKKVIVGMSGGVDSAVTAYLLKAAGFSVTGITLRTWFSAEGEESRCCEIDDARRVAWKIGIPYYAFNCVLAFQDNVTKPFVSEYLQGLTPNPCIVCNRFVKWEKMLYYAKVLKADFVATGHYASVLRLDNGRYTVQQALHAEKDQTYMLYKLTQEQLARTMMPLGKCSKEEVRRIAEEAGLPVANKKDSQEICFVTRGSYGDYIEKETDSAIRPGNFVDEKGTVVGTHKGIIHYTVGQRKGLGLALGYPAYVKRISAAANEIVVGDETSLYHREIICSELNYMSVPGIEEGETLRAHVKIRYHHGGEYASICPEGNGQVRVIFDNPVRAPAPGQSAVFYDENRCVIGGGKITGVL